MYAALIEFDLVFDQVESRKQKRSLVRPIVAEIQRRWAVAAAETGHVDLLRRSCVGVAVIANDASRCREVGEEIERFVAARPEADLLSARWRWVGPGDECEPPLR